MKDMHNDVSRLRATLRLNGELMGEWVTRLGGQGHTLALVAASPPQGRGHGG
jgi:hypothetical protein